MLPSSTNCHHSNSGRCAKCKAIWPNGPAALIASGYHYRSDWDLDQSKLWFKNVREVFADAPLFVSTTGERPALHEQMFRGINIGHIGDLLGGQKPYPLCGWSASILFGCMAAYSAGKDLIFCEQDCFPHGPIVKALYQACEGKQMVFGSNKLMGVAQALFLIRNGWLLNFIHDYVGLPSDRDMLPEHKFAALEAGWPNEYGRFAFGCDRDRPIPWDDEVFYVQQLTGEELEEWKRRHA